MSTTKAMIFILSHEFHKRLVLFMKNFSGGEKFDRKYLDTYIHTCTAML